MADGGHDHAATAAILGAHEARIKALEAASVTPPVTTPPVEPPVEPPTTAPSPPAGKTVSVSTDLTVAQFRSLAKDTSIRVIKFGPGKYRGGYQYGWRDGSGALNVKRPQTFPLTLWADGEVNFDGAGAPASYYGDQAFYLGGCQWIEFDGRAGAFLFTNYLIGQTGIFLVTNSQDLAFKKIKAHDCAAGGTSNDQSSHGWYISTGVARINLDDVEFWNLRKANVPNAIGGLNCFHLYSSGVAGAGAKDVTIRNARVTDGNWAIVGRDGSTVSIDGLVATRCGNGVPAAVDLAGSSGSMKNSKSLSSVGKAIVWGGVKDGGGNGPWQ